MSLPVVQHFSDVLCVWAYASHVRLEEMAKRFEGRVQISMHFCPVFPDAIGKIETTWQARGGFAAYGDHVQGVGAQFDHLHIHQDVWRTTRPRSSGAAHMFLKAVQLAENAQGAPETLRASAYYKATWEIRKAFFEQARDISDRQVQTGIATRLGLDTGLIDEKIHSGAAMAALEADYKICELEKISGSPTIRMNAGRQILYGNVGFHLIEANLIELLRAPNKDDASWC